MSYNPYSLNGKTILITGASSGIGQSTAIECSKLGAHVVITGRNAERLQQTFDLLEGDGHMQVIAELTDSAQLEEMVQQLPLLDGVVNNAGIGATRPISFIKEDDLQRIFTTNTFAPMMLIKQLIRRKKLNNGASLVFTSSVAALNSTIGNAAYGSSKAALQAYTRYVARELSPKGIRANSVHPAMVETPLIQKGTFSDEELKKDMAHYPLGRYGKPEEIAWAIIYLLSDAASWITGHSLVIDGGATMK